MNRLENAGWKFYYEYFHGLAVIKPIDNKKELVFEGQPSKRDRNSGRQVPLNLEDRNEGLWSLNLNNYKTDDNKLPHLKKDKDTFELTTTYPGLLIGSGYHHETGALDELKLGFFFDYTSGLPLIPGSSIKGTLRSAFKDKAKFVVYLLSDILKEVTIDFVINEELIKDLENEIFEGKDIRDNKIEYLPALKRDIFYDAIILKSEHPVLGNKGQSTGGFLGPDFITPHKHKTDRFLDPFTNPTPLQFLKVLPNVSFLFQFDLQNSLKYQLITKDIKIKLFKQILLNLGIGAKTNVGYGQFTDANK